MFMYVLSFYLYSMVLKDGCSMLKLWNAKHLTTELGI